MRLLQAFQSQLYQSSAPDHSVSYHSTQPHAPALVLFPGSEAPAPPEGVVCVEFVVDVRSLWSLHPNVDMCQLRLPLGSTNVLVLVTEEGGARGPLVIQQDTYDALRQLVRGGHMT